MKALNLTLRIAGATLLLLSLQAVWSRVWTGTQLLSRQGSPVLSSLFVVLALALVAASSHQQGWKLSATLFILYFGINQLNTLDETLIFRIGLKRPEILRLMASGLCIALIFTPLLVLILGYWKGSGQEETKRIAPRSAAAWAGWIMVGDLLYILCYIAAGFVVSPYVRDFYAGVKMPDLSRILGMEIFRGLVYVAAGIAVTNGMKGEPGRAAAALGLSFPILAGVAPVLMHNPYMPDSVRLAHGFEIGICNLVYGALLGYLLTRKAVSR